MNLANDRIAMGFQVKQQEEQEEQSIQEAEKQNQQQIVQAHSIQQMFEYLSTNLFGCGDFSNRNRQDQEVNLLSTNNIRDRKGQIRQKKSKYSILQVQQNICQLFRSCKQTSNFQQNTKARISISQPVPVSKGQSSSINLSNLRQYFDNLGQHITPEMVLIQKKYTELESGVYILLKGRVCYIGTTGPRTCDSQRKNYLYNAAKMGIFTIANDPASFGSYQSNSAGYEYSIQLQQPLTVFQLPQTQRSFNTHLDISSNKLQMMTQDCLTLEQSILLKVPKQILKISGFQALFKKRMQILANAALVGLTNSSNFNFESSILAGSLFMVNTRLHSTFNTHTYKFNNKIQFSTISILSQGTVQPQSSFLSQAIHELTPNAILLPGQAYTVLSSSAKVLSIQNNLTLHYFAPVLVAAHKRMKEKYKFWLTDHRKNKKSCFQQIVFKREGVYSVDNRRNIQSFNSQINSPISLSRGQSQNSFSIPCRVLYPSASTITEKMKNHQKNKRKKLLTNLSKNYSNQLIITMEQIRKNVQFIEKQNQVIKRYYKDYQPKGGTNEYNILQKQRQTASQKWRKAYGNSSYFKNKPFSKNKNKNVYLSRKILFDYSKSKYAKRIMKFYPLQNQNQQNKQNLKEIMDEELSIGVAIDLQIEKQNKKVLQLCKNNRNQKSKDLASRGTTSATSMPNYQQSKEKQFCSIPFEKLHNNSHIKKDNKKQAKMQRKTHNYFSIHSQNRSKIQQNKNQPSRMQKSFYQLKPQKKPETANKMCYLSLYQKNISKQLFQKFIRTSHKDKQMNRCRYITNSKNNRNRVNDQNQDRDCADFLNL